VIPTCCSSEFRVNFAQKYYYDYKVTGCPAMTMTHGTELLKDSGEDTL
jgi:hypothetical protein